jgi:hypothetical protein
VLAQSFIGRYRGERSIAAIETCSDHLVYPKK